MSGGSLVRRVALDAAAVLLGALVITGVGTGGVLHVQAREALDRALLAAAHGDAHPEAEGEWEVEHSRSPVETWRVRPGDRRVPADLARRVLEAERPAFADLGELRVVLLPVEQEHEGRGRSSREDDGEDDREDGLESGHEHLLVAAAAPRVTLAASVGPFALAYALVAAIAAVAAGAVLAQRVGGAVEPLARARDTSARVVRLGQGTRLPVEGPEEIRGLLQDLNALLDRLDDAYQAQARFTAEAAHELRTPVAALLGEIEVTLRRPRDPEAYRETLLAVQGDALRLRSLVEALMTLARLDTGQLDAGRERVRASEIVQAAARAEAASLQAAGCDLQVDLGPDPEITAHPALLGAAVANLLRNAAAHAPGAPVDLRVEVGSDTVGFAVEDRGPGVPVEDRERVFDRFARLGVARRDHPEGLGLGLPLAREVARRHGGDCTLQDRPGGGLRAVLTIFQSGSEEAARGRS